MQHFGEVHSAARDGGKPLSLHAVEDLSLSYSECLASCGACLDAMLTAGRPGEPAELQAGKVIGLRPLLPVIPCLDTSLSVQVGRSERCVLR